MALQKPTAKKDRFGRSRKKMADIAEAARVEDSLDGFLDYYKEFVAYTATIEPPFLTGNKHDDLMLLAAIGAAGEAGEMADVMKKVYFHDKANVRTMTKKRRLDAILEAGDFMWYFTIWLKKMRIDMRDVMQANMDKLTAR